MKDLIERQAAFDAFGLSEQTRKYGGDHSGYDTRMLYEIQETLENLPSAQPEPSIPILWIEKHVDWLKNMDNGFANLTAMNISTMVKKWEKEQEEADGSDKPTGGD